MTTDLFPTFRKDQTPAEWSAAELQRMSDMAAAVYNMKAGPGIRIKRNPLNIEISTTPIEIPKQEATPVTGADIQIFQIQDFPTLTHLPCNQLTGTDAGSVVNVAKPHDLRGVAFPNVNGYFINGVRWNCSSYQQSGNRRTATNTLVSETQIITKTYEIDDFILAVRVTEEVTQLSNIEWYDLNVMGRNWARLFGT